MTSNSTPRRTLTFLSLLLTTALFLASCVSLEQRIVDDPEQAGDGSDPAATIEDDSDAGDPTATPEPDQPTPTPVPETDDAGPDLSGEAWLERGRLTMLLVGSDAAFDRSGDRTDAMMVASLNLETGQVTLFGVPRNYGDVPLPEDIASVMGMDSYPGMLKILYEDASNYPELAPEGGDPGLVALSGAIGELLGLRIDYYAMIDMQGFIEMVDAFGGVTMDVPEPVQVRMYSPIEGVGWQDHEIQAGEQTLSGEEALAFVRSRTGTSDYDRMRRQRCLIQAVSAQADLPTILTSFPDLVEIIRDNVVTNIPIDMLPDMVLLRDEVQTDNVVSIGFEPPDYLAGRSSEGHNLPAFDRIQTTVQNALENPDQFLTGEGGPAASIEQHC